MYGEPEETSGQLMILPMLQVIDQSYVPIVSVQVLFGVRWGWEGRVWQLLVPISAILKNMFPAPMGANGLFLTCENEEG
jgi:hypothetical protein